MARSCKYQRYYVSLHCDRARMYKANSNIYYEIQAKRAENKEIVELFLLFVQHMELTIIIDVV